jgi:hypothetical protein
MPLAYTMIRLGMTQDLQTALRGFGHQLVDRAP